MIKNYFPLYTAHKHPQTGKWYVMNGKGELQIECDCRHQAEEFSVDLNEHARPSPERLAAMLAQLSRGPVYVSPFDAPDDEVFIFPEEI